MKKHWGKLRALGTREQLYVLSLILQDPAMVDPAGVKAANDLALQRMAMYTEEGPFLL